MSELEKLQTEVKLWKREAEDQKVLAKAALSALNHIVERLPPSKRDWLEASVEMQIIDLLKNNWKK